MIGGGGNVRVRPRGIEVPLALARQARWAVQLGRSKRGVGTGGLELRSRGVRHGVQLEMVHRMVCGSGWRRSVGIKYGCTESGGSDVGCIREGRVSRACARKGTTRCGEANMRLRVDVEGLPKDTRGEEYSLSR